MRLGSHSRIGRDPATWTGIAVVGLAAAVLSFDALRQLAQRAGVAPELAWLLPLAVDAAVVVATRAWLTGTEPRVRNHGRGLALTALTLSVAGNAVEHWLAAYRAATIWWVVVAVSAVPPVMLGATAHLAALLTAHPTTARDTATTATTATTAARAAEAAAARRPAEPDRQEPSRATATASHRHARPADAAAAPAGSRGSGTAAEGGSKTALMREVFDRYRAEGRLEQLTGAELARAAGATASLGRRYLTRWRDETATDTTTSTGDGQDQPATGTAAAPDAARHHDPQAA